MIEVVENKVKRSLKIRKINVWVMIATIATFVIALGFMYSDNLYFRFLFALPIASGYYYYHRIVKYKKDLEYLPKFLHAYSRLKEKEELTNKVSDGNDADKVKIIYKDKIKTKTVYKDKIIYKDKVVYKDKIVNVPSKEKIVYRDKEVDKIIEKIIEKPVEKIVYRDKIVKEIVYKTKVKKVKEGYVKKKNIYEDNNIFKAIEEMLAKQFYNVPVADRAKRIYSMINQINVDKKDQFEYEKEKSEP